MSTELEVSIEKKSRSVFEKVKLFFNLFIREKGKLFLDT